MVVLPARYSASRLPRNTRRSTITAVRSAKPFRSPTICSMSKATPPRSARRPGRTRRWGRPLSSPSSASTAPSSGCAISWRAPIPRFRSSAPRETCCAPPPASSPSEKIEGADGGQGSRRSFSCPLPENVQAGSRGLCAAAHLYFDRGWNRSVLLPARLVAAGDAPADQLGYFRYALSGARLHHDISLRDRAYPAQSRATGRRPFSDSNGDLARGVCQHRRDRVRTGRIASQRAGTDAGDRDDRVVLGGGAHHFRAALRPRLLPAREARRLAVSQRRRARARRLLGLCVFLVRDRHDRAGLRRRHYRQDHPPHRDGARHHLFCFQHRAGRIDGQYRRQCDLAKACEIHPCHSGLEIKPGPIAIDIAMSRGPGAFDNTRLWLWALARHYGLVRVATPKTFRTGKRPCLLRLRPGAIASVVTRRAAINAILTLRAHAPARTVILVALDGRLAAPLFAFIVAVEERALAADDFAAAVAIGLEAVLADHRTDARRLDLDRVKRIDTRNLDVEFCPGVTVEQRHRALRGRVPFAIGIRGETADAAQLDLNRFGQIGRRRPGGQRGYVDGFLASFVVFFNVLGVLGRRRAGRSPVRGSIDGGDLLGKLVGYFGCRTFLLGRGGLLLRDLLGLFGGNAGLLRRFRIRFGGLELLGLLCAFGGQPRPLLFGQSRLLGRRDAGFLGGNPGDLDFGQVCVEPVRILREEGAQCVLVADLQRQFVIPARLRLGIGRGRGWGGFGCRHQRHIVAAERAVDKRLLLVAGGLQHLVAHESERPAHIEPRRRQVLCQCQRERAVLGITVQRRRAGLGRIGDQHVRTARLDLAKTLPDPA